MGAITAAEGGSVSQAAFPLGSAGRLLPLPAAANQYLV